ncbi:OmpH family outer membrane protein [Ursidibacter sp. B-7004-1]
MKNLFKITTVAAILALSNTANANDRIGFADPGYLLQNHPAMVEASAKFEQFMKETEKKFADEGKKLEDEDKALVAERNKIEEDAQKLQKEQGTLEASLKKKVAALEKDAPRLRAKEIQSRQNAINAEQKAFQNKVENLQKRESEFTKKAEAFQKKAVAFQEKLAKEQQNSGIDPNEIQKKAVEEINVAIKTLAESKGYTLVLSPAVALYAKDEKADITEEVLTVLKANNSEKATEINQEEKKAETQAK